MLGLLIVIHWIGIYGNSRWRWASEWEKSIGFGQKFVGVPPLSPESAPIRQKKSLRVENNILMVKACVSRDLTIRTYVNTRWWSVHRCSGDRREFFHASLTHLFEEHKSNKIINKVVHSKHSHIFSMCYRNCFLEIR
jgi:hypothetical protein